MGSGNWRRIDNMITIETYSSDLDEEKAFEDLFFEGVVFRHVNSGVLWTITKIEEQSVFDWGVNIALPPGILVASTPQGQTLVQIEKVAHIKSQKGYKKRITKQNYYNYELHDAPLAVRVLFEKRPSES